MHEPFSVLLPVYAKDCDDHVARAFRSVVDDQTVRPDQVVIVRDGPVDASLAQCLDRLCETSPVPVTVVPLDRNVGLGRALDVGLDACWFDLVARMDADDVAMPNRFEAELPAIANADIVGAGLLEFCDDTDGLVGQRVPPTEQLDQYARMHDPFNHPTVIYRRGAVIAAGGYGSLPLMEDYALFMRMLNNGARAVNLTEPLILYRVGEDAFKRRGGLVLLRSELRLQREFRKAGYVTRYEYARNVLIRGGYRIVPWQLRRAAYTRMVPRYAEKMTHLTGTTAAYVLPENALTQRTVDLYDDELELRAIA